jgi:hypothetical protein
MAIRKIISRSIGVDVIAAEDLAANSVTVSEISNGAVSYVKLAADAQPTPTKVSDVANTSTGQFGIPAGTSAQRPGTSYTGAQRFNTDLGVMEYYNGSAWLKISSEIAVLNSVTGTIYAGAASTLTLAGTGFLTSNLVVNFLQSSDSINANVTVTPSSDTAATVTVSSAVYSNVTAGNVVAVKVTNSDGQSSTSINETAIALPTGGNITTSGSSRIHRFTSSSNFVVPSGFSATAEYLVVAGGGGGGTDADVGGGGGAGGLLAGSTSITPQTYSVVVGAGGSGGTNSYTPGTGAGGNGAQGGTSSALGVSTVGGGYGGTRGQAGGNGGSGGGGGDFQGNGGTGTAGQGNNGGGSIAGNANSGNDQGGGGGKGSAGVTWTPGNGLTSSISGSSVVYAKGGAGSGGGGPGLQAPANTGQGGRGGATTADTTGGSGVVIIKYTL